MGGQVSDLLGEGFKFAKKKAGDMADKRDQGTGKPDEFAPIATDTGTTFQKATADTAKGAVTLQIQTSLTAKGATQIAPDGSTIVFRDANRDGTPEQKLEAKGDTLTTTDLVTGKPTIKQNSPLARALEGVGQLSLGTRDKEKVGKLDSIEAGVLSELIDAAQPAAPLATPPAAAKPATKGRH